MIPKSTHNCLDSRREASIISTIRAVVLLREASLSLSRKPIMTKSMGVAAVIAALLLAPACTDLTEVPQSAITPENFYRNEDEVIGGLASVYAQLRSLNDDYYNTSEITTDEMVVPTRGSDWYDNGQWLDLHRQT